ncbi:MAG: hypothetical protein ABI627_17435 [Polyangiaceae bacterium]
MSSKFAKVLWVACALLAAPLAVGCGAGQTQAGNVAKADQRLSASWRLQSFAPVVPLDLPLQAVLSAELGTLIVTFNQGQFSAVGPGVNLSGHYEVKSAEGDQLSLMVFDPQGVAHYFTAQFAGNLLHFESTDKPWAGYGALEHT